MIGSFLIISISMALFVYWFRYTCVLILRARPARDYAARIAEANQLQFPTVQSELPLAAEGDKLDALERLLERDYRLLTYLLRHAAEFRDAGNPLERHMLMLDYRLMRVWYAVSRRISLAQGRTAVQEMAFIINHFAEVMGEHRACAAA